MSCQNPLLSLQHPHSLPLSVSLADHPSLTSERWSAQGSAPALALVLFGNCFLGHPFSHAAWKSVCMLRTPQRVSLAGASPWDCSLLHPSACPHGQSNRPVTDSDPGPGLPTVCLIKVSGDSSSPTVEARTSELSLAPPPPAYLTDRDTLPEIRLHCCHSDRRPPLLRIPSFPMHLSQCSARLWPDSTPGRYIFFSVVTTDPRMARTVSVVTVPC